MGYILAIMLLHSKGKTILQSIEKLAKLFHLTVVMLLVKIAAFLLENLCFFYVSVLKEKDGGGSGGGRNPFDYANRHSSDALDRGVRVLEVSTFRGKCIKNLDH